MVACRGKTVEGLAFLRCPQLHGQLIIQGNATVVPSLLMGHHLSREEARRGKVVAVVHAGVRLCGLGVARYTLTVRLPSAALSSW